MERVLEERADASGRAQEIGKKEPWRIVVQMISHLKHHQEQQQQQHKMLISAASNWGIKDFKP